MNTIRLGLGETITFTVSRKEYEILKAKTNKWKDDLPLEIGGVVIGEVSVSSYTFHPLLPSKIDVTFRIIKLGKSSLEDI